MASAFDGNFAPRVFTFASLFSNQSAVHEALSALFEVGL